MRHTIILVFTALMSFGIALAQEETPAKPISRQPPTYPAECLAKSSDGASPQYVTLMFDIDRRGDVENVRVRESSDPCFEPVSVAAARGWKYEPRRVGSARASQDDMEVTLTFVVNTQTQTEEYDARPTVRVPPNYPRKCMRSAKEDEAVLVRYDVNERGTTENVEVQESINKCLNEAAAESVIRWKFRPKLIEGAPVARRGVQTVIHFRLSKGSSAGDMRMRTAVQRKLARAQRYGQQPDKLQEANAILDEIYAEYSETFSARELAAYHQVRALVKINEKDYAAALDSLRIVHRTGGADSEEAREAVEDLIYQLETTLGMGPTAPGEEHESDEATSGKDQ
ncbi:TonB family protein [Hyphococcus sp.]|uniref:energy transducer TonB n=1 Tax=Hyphococcus sp. TaxID=2038636 RepID=UPI003D129E49